MKPLSKRQQRIKENNIKKNTPKKLCFDNHRTKKTKAFKKWQTAYLK